MTAEFLDRFYKNTQTSNSIKICPVGAELFHADGDGRTDRYTDRHDEAYSSFATFCENV